MSSVTELIRKGPRQMASRFWGGRAAALQPAPASTPRIVILSASVGAGHVRAAQAIQSSLARMLPDAMIAHVDVLQLTSGPFRSVYGKGYFRAVERAPHLVGLLYDMLDRSNRGGAVESMRIAMERLNFTRLTRFLASQPWDLVINTHFLPPELVGWMRRNGKIDVPQVTVVTDFEVHGLWINRPCEHYFVATEEARASLIASGVDGGNVDVSGIPIDPVFARPGDPQECRRKHGLHPSRPVVLQMAGGFGIGPIEQIHRSILDVAMPLQVVVVAGKNAAVRERLESMPFPERHKRRVIGFTTEMDELMTAADVIVSKPGGLTTSEALARGCAMAIVDPIPGQEERNSDFLLENGCAIKVNSIAVLTHKLSALLEDRPRLERMRAAAKRCGRPRAAFDVASRCVDLLRASAVHF